MQDIKIVNTDRYNNIVLGLKTFYKPNEKSNVLKIKINKYVLFFDKKDVLGSFLVNI